MSEQKDKKPVKGYNLPIGPNEPSIWGKLTTLVVIVIGAIARKITGK